MEEPEVLKKPIFSEKSLKEVTKGRYTFEVAKEANKKQIAKAVEKEFKVDVLSVKTIVLKGKRVRIRGTNREKTGEIIKKAVVQLKKDQKISVFEVAK
ncbi:MAG: 50S ribosomal protein L23 [Candidatus Woykebacteria bacterium RIFCSPLOWO2_01_FULL_41_12]|uniref:Large ribosomal subunit protein uL23 n=1 Tax=Candidatus Woykebacteria bacterium RIFCSPLOWO2_01_FULL_41_12 TaxID=1802604 RepID=A0A1G1WTA9_9BACT|nr:MAG: 50S ribosomal protein L23 [Candidatus Woykebacteria bacterium RIFCSPLOWO2_01_FULL_41_12]